MRLLSIAFLSVCAAHAQTYTIQTIAGSALPENVPCTAAVMDDITFGLTADAAGNLYVPFTQANVVERCDAATGMLTRVAGTGAAGFSNGDNVAATSVRVTAPIAVALDPAGNLYIAESARVRRVSNGMITTVAGNGIAGFSGDGGPAAQAEITPIAIAADASGDVFIVENNNSSGYRRVREVSGGIIRTVAGVAPGVVGSTADNVPATSAAIDPLGVAVDSAGTLYIANSRSGVRKVASGIITTVTTSITAIGVVVDPGGNLYAADLGVIYKITGGTATAVTPPGSIVLDGSFGVDAAGNVYYHEYYSEAYDDIQENFHYPVRKYSNGTLTTVMGGGETTPGNGPPAVAQLAAPGGVALDSAGTIYFSEPAANRVRKLSNGVLTTVAGNGTLGFSGDGGPATAAQLASPAGLAVDSQGALYIADTYNQRIRKVINGVISTVVGNGTKGGGGNGGPALQAQLFRPVGLAVDSAGTLYITDSENLVRKVSNGIISIAACNGTNGYVGENVPATSAQCSYPVSLTVDGSNNLYFADTFNGYVRKVTPDGIITTVAGIGHMAGDEMAAIDALVGPSALAIDAQGNVYLGEGSTIRKITGGLISTIAGGGAGDNLARSVTLGNVAGLALDSSGNLYAADSTANLLRQLTPHPSTPVSIASVWNAATNVRSWIAPGEVIVIAGSGLGPVNSAVAPLTVDGIFGTSIAGVSVQVNGVAAPMIYASDRQVAAVVPYESVATAAPLDNQVTVTYNGAMSNAFKIAGAPWALGLFTANATGAGQAAAVNQDGTLNGASRPAPRGSIVSLYATGEGSTMPGGIDGKPASAPLPMPVSSISVTIGGQVVTPDYAGGAPGEIAGLMQINVRIPQNIAPGNAVPVTVEVPGYSTSQSGVTIAVGQ